MSRLAAAVLAISAAACTDVANDAAANPSGALNENVFRCKVEPILVRDCSYTGCHGNAGFALRVYSAGKLRATTPRNIDDAIAKLTDAEEHANFLSAAAFSFGGVAPEDNMILRKTISSIDGGFEHKGGAVFSDPGDPRYVAVRDWLAGKGACP